MEIFKKKDDIKASVEKLKRDGKKTGFVPTMGALHEGHASLVSHCGKENDITIVSIFVNPTQFNNKNDLDKYPRDLDKDLSCLEASGCDMVFVPEVEEMYPDDKIEKFDLGALDNLMEGKFRPGHFQGVAVIVKRLFGSVPAHNAYFGKKDFQQLAIIKYMVKNLDIPINIIPCETIRDKDGLAKSSRNLLLTEKHRKISVLIPQTLFKCKQLKNSKTPDELRKFVYSEFEKSRDLTLEYFELVNDENLQPVSNWNNSKKVTACIAVWAGNVRLIDNVTL